MVLPNTQLKFDPRSALVNSRSTHSHTQLSLSFTLEHSFDSDDRILTHLQSTQSCAGLQALWFVVVAAPVLNVRVLLVLQ